MSLFLFFVRAIRLIDVCFVHRDLESFHEFFESPDFRTDGLKLYPTLVIRGTGLYELWRTGRYKNYAPDRLVDLVARVLALVPPWVRVYRVQRDIPMPLVSVFLFWYIGNSTDLVFFQ